MVLPSFSQRKEVLGIPKESKKNKKKALKTRRGVGHYRCIWDWVCCHLAEGLRPNEARSAAVMCIHQVVLNGVPLTGWQLLR